MRSSLTYKFSRDLKRKLQGVALSIRRYLVAEYTPRDTNSKAVQLSKINMNLHIFYRHVHTRADNSGRFISKNRPGWFSHEQCFINLINTIRLDPFANRVKIVVVFDGTPDELQDDFIAKFRSHINPTIDIKIIHSESALEAFMIMLGIVKKSSIPQDDIIYLLENDYLHQPGWVGKIFELYESEFKFDIATLYDHPDLYNLPKHSNSSSRLLHSFSHHWRTAPSTCASFLLTKKSFDRDIDVFRSCIPDYRIFNKLVKQRGRILLAPVPGLSTHCMQDYLTPCVDWEKINSDIRCD